MYTNTHAMSKHKKLTVIFGNMTFLEKLSDGEDKAIINDARSMREIYNADSDVVEQYCEDVIGSGEYDSYLIPELYRFPIEYGKDSTKNMVIEEPQIL